MYIKRFRQSPGGKTAYIALAYNTVERRPDSKTQTRSHLIASLGREDKMDPRALKDLVTVAQTLYDLRIKDGMAPLSDTAEVKRALTPHVPALKDEKDAILESRRIGMRLLLEPFWRELGLDEVLRDVAKRHRIRAFDFERLVFGLILNRIVDPMSKLAANDWLQQDAFFPEAEGWDAQHYYRALDVLHEHWGEATGTIFVTDTDNNTIRKITPIGAVTTLAGNTRGGFQDGSGANASFYRPTGICIDTAGNLIVADSGNNCIRKVTQQGEVSTIAGSILSGFRDGQGTSARFNNPFGVAVDKNNNIYITDAENHSLRKIAYGHVSTLAGNGDFGDIDGVGPLARFDEPLGIAIAANGFMYIADTNNNYFRTVSPNGTVTTIAGSGYEGSTDGVGNAAVFAAPSGIVLETGGGILVADSNNHRLRRVKIK